MARLAKWIFGLCGTACAIAIVGALVWIYRPDPAHLRDEWPRAIYEGFYFNGRLYGGSKGPRQKFDEFWSEGDIEAAELFIQVPDGRVFRMAELTEGIVATFAKVQETLHKSANVQWYQDDSASFHFLEHRIVRVKIKQSGYLSNDGPRYPEYQLSPRKDGPFLALPAYRESLIEVFGEPASWMDVPFSYSGH